MGIECVTRTSEDFLGGRVKNVLMYRSSYYIRRVFQVYETIA